MATKPLTYEGSNYFRQRLILATLSGRSVKINRIRSKDHDPGLRGKITRSKRLTLHSCLGLFIILHRWYHICDMSALETLSQRPYGLQSASNGNEVLIQRAKRLCTMHLSVCRKCYKTLNTHVCIEQPRIWHSLFANIRITFFCRITTMVYCVCQHMLGIHRIHDVKARLSMASCQFVLSLFLLPSLFSFVMYYFVIYRVEETICKFL